MSATRHTRRIGPDEQVVPGSRCLDKLTTFGGARFLHGAIRTGHEPDGSLVCIAVSLDDGWVRTTSGVGAHQRARVEQELIDDLLRMR